MGRREAFFPSGCLEESYFYLQTLSREEKETNRGKEGKEKKRSKFLF